MFKLELIHSLSKRDYRGGSVCCSFADIQELILPVYGSLSFEISGKFSPRDKIFAQGGRMPLPLWQCPTEKKTTVSDLHEVQAASAKAVPQHCHSTLTKPQDEPNQGPTQPAKWRDEFSLNSSTPVALMLDQEREWECLTVVGKSFFHPSSQQHELRSKENNSESATL